MPALNVQGSYRKLRLCTHAYRRAWKPVQVAVMHACSKLRTLGDASGLYMQTGPHGRA